MFQFLYKKKRGLLINRPKQYSKRLKKVVVFLEKGTAEEKSTFLDRHTVI